LSRLNLREIELAYDDSSSGPAIVLLHGYPFDRSMWREQIDFLGNHGHRVVAPDLRGLGESKSRDEIATMNAMARDVEALMDELKIDRAVVCGLSMGSYVGLEFVHLFPSRAQALILAGARAQGADALEKKSRQEQAERVLREGLGLVADAMLPKLLARRTLAEKPDIVASVREMILRTNPQGAAAAQRGMAARRDHTSDLSKIDMPTLIIAGREDPIRAPDDADFLHRGIRNSRLEIIADAAHLMNMEQPEVFNHVLTDFLQEVFRGRTCPSIES